MNPWLVLILAGLLETGWAVGLKYTNAFTRFWPSVWTVLALAASMILLAIAVRSLPIGTAYPVWVGIGAIGTAAYGMLILGEPISAVRILFLLMLVVAIIGLKATSSAPTTNQLKRAVPTHESDSMPAANNSTLGR